MLNKNNVKLILDTHIFLWLVSGDETLTLGSREIIGEASQEGEIGISAISIWEIAMLSNKQRILLKQPCLQWIRQALELPSISLIPLNPEIAVESCSLPSTFHGDPADRIIVATARILHVPLISYDQRIIQYSQAGFLKCYC